MKFLLRMLFARRPTEPPAAQLKLFGGGAPQPPPAPATGAREGVGVMHQVKTHTRVDAHGVHLVQQHQRVGKGHQVARPTEHQAPEHQAPMETPPAAEPVRVPDPVAPIMPHEREPITSDRDVSEWEIPPEKLAALRAKLDGLAKKARRLGLQPPTLEITGEERDQTRTITEVDPFEGVSRTRSVTRRVVPVKITGPTIKAPGWNVIGMFEPTPAGNLLTSFGGELPAHLHGADATCEHCNTARDRKRIFVMRSEKDGSLKKIGGSCVEEFTGLNPHSMAGTAAFMQEFYGGEEGDFSGFANGGPPLPDVKDVLIAACYSHDKYGFVRSWDAQSTAQHVRDIFGRDKRIDRPTGAAYLHAKARADAVLTWMKSIPADTDSSFLRNLRTLADLQQIPHDRSLAVLAAAPQTYDLEMGKARRREMERFFGAPGDKIGPLTSKDRKSGITSHAPVHVRLASKRVIDTDFGPQTILRFEDTAGHTFVWKTSAARWHDWSTGEDAGLPFEHGMGFIIEKATIDTHNDYRGAKETKIVRPKITLDVPPEERTAVDAITAEAAAFRVARRAAMGGTAPTAEEPDPYHRRRALEAHITGRALGIDDGARRQLEEDRHHHRAAVAEVTDTGHVYTQTTLAHLPAVRREGVRANVGRLPWTAGDHRPNGGMVVAMTPGAAGEMAKEALIPDAPRDASEDDHRAATPVMLRAKVDATPFFHNTEYTGHKWGTVDHLPADRTEFWSPGEGWRPVADFDPAVHTHHADLASTYAARFADLSPERHVQPHADYDAPEERSDGARSVRGYQLGYRPPSYDRYAEETMMRKATRFMLRMRLARRLQPGEGQLGLFGTPAPATPAPATPAPATPAPATPAPATGAKEGVGAMHQVKTHTRVDAHGVHLVQQHQRVGKGHQAKPAGHHEDGDPLDPKALFRLGGPELRELLEKHKADPVARGKVQAEIDRRAAKRASKRGASTTPATGHKLTDELVERVPGFDGGDEFRHGGHDWNVEQAGDNVEFHPVERGADADGLVEHLDDHGVDAAAREEVVVATGVRAEDPEPEQPPQDKEQATKNRWEAIHQRLEDEREAMYAKMIGRGQSSSERKKLVAASEDEEALHAHLQVETDPFVRQVAEKRLAELEAKRKAAEPEPAAADKVEDEDEDGVEDEDEDEDGVEDDEQAAKDDGPVGDGAVTARSASRGSETAIEEASRALGEHIAYSRKDMATLRGAAALEEARRSGATAMDIDKMLRKDKVFDKPEYAQLHNLGVPPDVAQARVELHKLLAAKPSVPSKLMKRMDARALAAAAEIVQAGYAQMAEWWPKQLDAATNLHDVELTLARLGQWATHGRELSDAMTAEEVIAHLRLDADKVRIQPGELSGRGSGYRLKGERGDYWIPQGAIGDAGASGWWTNSFHPEAGRRYHVMGMPDAAMKLRYGSMASSCGDRFLAVCADDFKRNQLLRAAKGKTWSDHLVDEVGKMEAKDKREQSPKAKLAGFVHGYRGAESYERVGPELPRIAGEDLLKRYGFRGVQTGQKAWVSDEAFAGHLQHTHEAFADLAHVLGMDERHVSHGGLLGMAFGARGKGGRAGAHYEPTDLVINLTQTKGGGALAHEWGHFFDHIMTNKARPVRTTVDGKEVTRNGEELIIQGTGRKVEYRSHFLSHEDVNEELPEPVRDALHGVLDAMHGRHASYRELQSVLKRSREARERHGMHSREYMQHGETRAALQRAVDKHVSDRQLSLKDGDSMAFADAAMLLGDYWSAPHEMWARAFESYIEDKLDAQGRKNNYLVTGTRRGGIEMTINVGSRGRTATVLAHAYPMGEERARINAAFDRFFDTVRQHQLLRKAVARLVLPRQIRRGA